MAFFLQLNLSTQFAILSLRSRVALEVRCCRWAMLVRQTLVSISCTRSISLELGKSPGQDQISKTVDKMSRISLLEDQHLLLFLRKGTRLLPFFTVCTRVSARAADFLSFTKGASVLCQLMRSCRRTCMRCRVGQLARLAHVSLRGSLLQRDRVRDQPYRRSYRMARDREDLVRYYCQGGVASRKIETSRCIGIGSHIRCRESRKS